MALSDFQTHTFWPQFYIISDPFLNRSDTTVSSYALMSFIHDWNCEVNTAAECIC